MGSKSRFMKMVDRVPVPNDKLVGQAVSWFIGRQEPDNVEFNQYKNGYTIEVRTDEDSASEAREFWENYVHTELDGE